MYKKTIKQTEHRIDTRPTERNTNSPQTFRRNELLGTKMRSEAKKAVKAAAAAAAASGDM